MIELRKEDTQEVLKGWFTPEQMKTELKWTTNLSCITGLQDLGKPRLNLHGLIYITYIYILIKELNKYPQCSNHVVDVPPVATLLVGKIDVNFIWGPLQHHARVDFGICKALLDDVSSFLELIPEKFIVVLRSVG